MRTPQGFFPNFRVSVTELQQLLVLGRLVAFSQNNGMRADSNQILFYCAQVDLLEFEIGCGYF